MPIDARCIQLASHGDRDAQRVIYESLVDRVHRLVLRIVGPSDAEDVTQNAFLRLFAKLSSFRHESEFATWAHRLAVNEALQHVRRVRRHVTTQLTPVDAIQVCSHASCDHAEDLKELLEKAMSRIDREQQLILELREMEQMSYSQIADVLGISEGTVGSRLNRARRELREHLLVLGWEG